MHDTQQQIPSWQLLEACLLTKQRLLSCFGLVVGATVLISITQGSPVWVENYSKEVVALSRPIVSAKHFFFLTEAAQCADESDNN